MVFSAAFGPGGTRVVTASGDQTARIWGTTTGAPLRPLLQHQGAVLSAAFSPDGARVVTASEDHTARIWNASTGVPLTLPLQHQDSVLSAAFSPDGSLVVTASGDQTARVWRVLSKERSLSVWQELAKCSPFRVNDGAIVPNTWGPSSCVAGANRP